MLDPSQSKIIRSVDTHHRVFCAAGCFHVYVGHSFYGSALYNWQRSNIRAPKTEVELSGDEYGRYKLKLVLIYAAGDQEDWKSA